MEIYLPYYYQNALIVLHSKPVKSVLQCLMESVTRITHVWSGALLMHFGSNMANIKHGLRINKHVLYTGVEEI